MRNKNFKKWNFSVINYGKLLQTTKYKNNSDGIVYTFHNTRYRISIILISLLLKVTTSLTFFSKRAEPIGLFLEIQ